MADDFDVSKAFAWILFLSTAVCFVVQLSVQELAVSANRLHAECDRPTVTTQPVWQTADASDLNDY